MSTGTPLVQDVHDTNEPDLRQYTYVTGEENHNSCKHIPTGLVECSIDNGRQEVPHAVTTIPDPHTLAALSQSVAHSVAVNTVPNQHISTHGTFLGIPAPTSLPVASLGRQSLGLPSTYLVPVDNTPTIDANYAVGNSWLDTLLAPEQGPKPKRLRSANWSVEEELVLIQLFKELEIKYESRRALWEALSCALSEKDYDRKPVSLEMKWSNMLQTYRSIKDYSGDFFELDRYERKALFKSWQVNSIVEKTYVAMSELFSDKGAARREEARCATASQQAVAAASTLAATSLDALPLPAVHLPAVHHVGGGGLNPPTTPADSSVGQAQDAPPPASISPCVINSISPRVIGSTPANMESMTPAPPPLPPPDGGATQAQKAQSASAAVAQSLGPGWRSEVSQQNQQPPAEQMSPPPPPMSQAAPPPQPPPPPSPSPPPGAQNPSLHALLQQQHSLAQPPQPQPPQPSHLHSHQPPPQAPSTAPPPSPQVPSPQQYLVDPPSKVLMTSIARTLLFKMVEAERLLSESSAAEPERCRSFVALIADCVTLLPKLKQTL